MWFICTTMGTNPAAVLTELLHANSPCGKCLVVLSFVDDHRKHLSHSVIGALDATVAVGVLGARRNFPHA